MLHLGCLLVVFEDFSLCSIEAKCLTFRRGSELSQATFSYQNQVSFRFATISIEGFTTMTYRHDGYVVNGNP